MSKKQDKINRNGAFPMDFLLEWDRVRLKILRAKGRRKIDIPIHSSGRQFC